MPRPQLHAALALVVVTGAASPATADAHPTGATAPAVASRPTTARATCRLGWTSGEQQSSTRADGYARKGRIVVRTGTHPCFDRVVVEYLPRPGRTPVRWAARYTGRTAVDIDDGTVLPIRGKAVLALVVSGEPFGGGSQVLATPRGRPVVQQVRAGGYMRSTSGLNIGVTAERPYRVLDLPGPGGRRRLVIDIAR
ncbi:AMIN-like domain-containing (lipo)protein [Arsenicicoccus dermatophilus]|uniref:AMIN-like domain-containing (lipo)protein n=1 Tax=Arsenicicoccus dermatophilus TaxID=1076331 RepID=UPI001F4CCAAA|nr:hypothetical protein [Arsenicicoccus dermatophilus]MCH8613700.1 hypothetical protein [Arsenicicoccus dermatophilus]